jgi:hypothetical protein
MKHLKTINELFGLNTEIRSKMNKDEDKAIDILNKLCGLKHDKIDTDNNNRGVKTKTYEFELDGTHIKVFDRPILEISIDGNKLHVSNHIIEKIFSKCKDIRGLGISGVMRSGAWLSQLPKQHHKDIF